MVMGQEEFVVEGLSFKPASSVSKCRGGPATRAADPEALAATSRTGFFAAATVPNRLFGNIPDLAKSRWYRWLGSLHTWYIVFISFFDRGRVFVSQVFVSQYVSQIVARSPLKRLSGTA
ncbi:hypothetical protein [Mesorhizobium sp. J8]|uniref:hypothetical protein n=1 Tax=Mesorhizobium sp. J8 TaxID=2777475 RepID=UPI001915836E|nr:hypothetical protein [Mesorhizobium sp. J8]